MNEKGIPISDPQYLLFCWGLNNSNYNEERDTKKFLLQYTFSTNCKFFYPQLFHVLRECNKFPNKARKKKGMSLFHATFLLYAWFELLINPNICFINEKTKKKKREKKVQ